MIILLILLQPGNYAHSFPSDTVNRLETDLKCPEVYFSLPSGFYASKQTLQLFCPDSLEGISIYYTTDGAEPDTTDNLYNNPIIINRTVVIRARAFITGSVPGSIASRTFFINEHCTLPIVSLTTDPYNLWDEDYGIYVKGKHAEPNLPYFGANYWMDWERPAHIEFFEPQADTAAFSINLGIKIFGGWSRAHAQKSLAFFARKMYDERDIDYRLFPVRDITHYEAFVMRNSGNDWQFSMMRDGFMQSLLEGEMDLETLAFRPAVLFLNGQYWGILNLREKVNERYLQAHKNIDPDCIDMLEFQPSNPYVVLLQGNSEQYRQLMEFIDNNDMNSTASLCTVNSFIDIENFIHYMLAEIYFANSDWPGNNNKFWRPALPGGKWRWILFDTDFGFGLYNPGDYSTNTLQFALESNGPNYPNPPNSTLLLRSLLKNMAFRNEFINQFAYHLNTTFNPDRVNAILDYYISILEPEMSRHRQKWPESAQNWQGSTNVMKDFAHNRIGYIRGFIKKQFALRGTFTLTLNINGSANSFIKINSHTINTFPWKGIYFLDVPVTLTAVPEVGYQFTGWSGIIQNEALTVEYSSLKSASITANFTSCPQTDNSIVINEINYNSNNLMNPRDWIELYNYSNQSISLKGWKFCDSDDAHEFIFPAKSIIPAQGYLVICRDTLEFKHVHSGVINLTGNLDFDISNSGELLRLYDPNQVLVDSVTFSDLAPWPGGADGTGYTLELIDPLADTLQSQNWRVSSEFGGSPGVDNFYVLKIDDRQKPGDSFQLLQNYPNPFNASTQIQYILTEPGKVVLNVYNINGQQVAELLSDYQAAGAHTHSWTCTLANGVYFYRLEVTSVLSHYSAVRKMVYLK